MALNNTGAKSVKHEYFSFYLQPTEYFLSCFVENIRNDLQRQIKASSFRLKKKGNS